MASVYSLYALTPDHSKISDRTPAGEDPGGIIPKFPDHPILFRNCKHVHLTMLVVHHS